MRQLLTAFVTEEQIENLQTLYNYLRANAVEEEFDMRYFQAWPLSGDWSYFDYKRYPSKFKGSSACGTVACVLGHAPDAGLGIDIIKSSIGWYEYGSALFGFDAFAVESEPKYLLWEWVFSDGWSDIDNSIGGAVKRIEIALTEGVPLNTLRQLNETDPLEYDIEVAIAELAEFRKTL